MPIAALPIRSGSIALRVVSTSGSSGIELIISDNYTNANPHSD